jgi:hypothetical protein
MGYTQATAFVDGELVPISEAKISLLDGIFAFGCHLRNRDKVPGLLVGLAGRGACCQ